MSPEGLVLGGLLGSLQNLLQVDLGSAGVVVTQVGVPPGEVPEPANSMQSQPEAPPAAAKKDKTKAKKQSKAEARRKASRTRPNTASAPLLSNANLQPRISINKIEH